MSQNKGFGSELQLIQKAVAAGHRKGLGEDFWYRLANDFQFREEVHDFHRGKLSTTPAEYSVNVGSEPEPPESFLDLETHNGVETHRGEEEVLVAFEFGQIYVDGHRVRFIFTDEQLETEQNESEEDLVAGETMLSEMQGRLALGVHMRDFFAEHPRLIPRNVLEKAAEICFWGTLFRDKRSSSLVVPTLYIGKGEFIPSKSDRFTSSNYSVGGIMRFGERKWGMQQPAAVLKDQPHPSLIDE